MLRSWLAWALVLCATHAQAQMRLLDDADVVETPAHYDLIVRFGCDMRYLSHTPVEQGVELRVRLATGPNCAAGLQGAESLITPAPAVVRSIELSALLVGEVELLIRWRLTQNFLVAPNSDRQSLRIRILRAGEGGDTGRVLVDEVGGDDAATAYAINLLSSLAPIDAAEVERAQVLLRNRIYRSEVDVADTHWYRLRLGPIATRAEAERLLLAVQNSYPRAWLAIADEQLAEAAAVNDVAPGDIDNTADVSDSRINDPEADALWSEANGNFRSRNYAQAIVLLTQLTARASGKYRTPAQELLGIAHERRGELALAQAEYETFLRAWPKDRRAARVRKRMNALRTAALPGRSASGGDDNAEGVWHWNGGVAQYYRRDDIRLTVAAVDQNTVGQNALLNNIDLSGRYRGVATDMRVRLSAGYNKSFLQQSETAFRSSTRGKDQAHVTSAFIEAADRDRRWYASAGRQNRSSSGAWGTFDGAFASYQWLPHLTTEIVVGMPTDSSRSGVNTRRVFESLALEFGILANAWEPGIYVTHQTLEGRVDREAVGAQLRYFRPGRVFIALVDYDLYFRELNSAVLLGTVQLPGRWTLSLNAEHRKSPLLTTRNALIGQPTDTLAGLNSAFSDEQIKQLALERTPDTTVYGLTAARPVGERLQFTLSAQNIRTGATDPQPAPIDPGFAQVEGTAELGPETIVAAQLLAASIMRAGDINIVGLRRQSGGLFAATSLGLSSRVPVWGDFRLGPQLQVDRRRFESDGSVLWSYAPSLRLTLQRPTLQIDLEAGGEFSQRKTDIGAQDSRRFFYYLGYRWLF